jgi:hypothetical protein
MYLERGYNVCKSQPGPKNLAMPPRPFDVTSQDWIHTFGEMAVMDPLRTAKFGERLSRFETVISNNLQVHQHNLKGLRCFFVSISPTAASTKVDMGTLLPWFERSEQFDEGRDQLLLAYPRTAYFRMLGFHLVSLSQC